MDSKKSELTPDEGAKMAALLRAYIKTAILTGYTVQQLAEVATTLSCLLYSAAGCPKEEFLKAVGGIYESAGKLGEALGFTKDLANLADLNSPGGKA